MRRFIPRALALLLGFGWLSGLRSTAAPAADPWANLDRVAEEAVAAGDTPGVVFLVSQRGKVVYRKAFGSRRLVPEKEPMAVDTVFDLASLTKPVATASS